MLAERPALYPNLILIFIKFISDFRFNQNLKDRFIDWILDLTLKYVIVQILSGFSPRFLFYFDTLTKLFSPIKLALIDFLFWCLPLSIVEHWNEICCSWSYVFEPKMIFYEIKNLKTLLSTKYWQNHLISLWCKLLFATTYLLIRPIREEQGHVPLQYFE